MATRGNSAYDKESVPSAKDMKFGIVVSDWNKEVTHALMNAAVETLIDLGADEKNVLVKHVPGSFELTIGALFFAEYTDVDAVIAIGCVVQGETKHFDYICQGVTQGITDLNLNYNIPFIFGVLTTLDQQQALERAGGKHGNKGVEVAMTAIQMVALHNEFRNPDEEKFFLN